MNKIQEATLEQNAKYRVIEGKDDRVWTVVVLSRTGDKEEYIVEYPNQDKSQVVTLDEEFECSCTYSDYNDTCPHIEATDRVRNRVSHGVVSHEQLEAEAEIMQDSGIYD